MKILFVLGFPNPFPGAGWTRIGFLAKDWSNKKNAIAVLRAFNYTLLQKKGFYLQQPELPSRSKTA